MDNGYLQGFDSELKKEARKSTKSYEAFTLSKSEVEQITEVTYINDLETMETCFVAIRSVGNTLVAAMKTLMPVYIIGFALTLGGIYSALGNTKEF